MSSNATSAMSTTGNIPNVRILYTVKEVSEILHTNPSYVYELIHAGILPALRLGSYKIRHESLMKFLADYDGKDLRDPHHIVSVIESVTSDEAV